MPVHNRDWLIAVEKMLAIDHGFAPVLADVPAVSNACEIFIIADA